jgi:hypothetical protein
MNRASLALAVLLATTPLALAQSTPTRSEMNHYNDTKIVPNGTGAITGATANGMNDLIINGMGVLSDTNAWTGTNSFSGQTTFTGSVTLPVTSTIPNVQRGDPIPPAGQEFINASGFRVISQ